ncbi:MAG: M48 family metallopeptidase [Bacteroidales bacterium]|nr:M48 family metallopeptidase [Bacteroidales bacterium]MCF8457744.1 M48 family metallopeptidase [Bacteroidales bacterium]
MNRISSQLVITLVLFFAVWFALSRVDWIDVLNIEHINKTTEEKLGEFFWDIIKQTEKEIQDHDIELSIDSILSRICDSNHIEKDNITLHLVEKDEVNAFALPGNHLVLYRGLILATDDEAALCGVICHEIAHMEKNHVMKKLVKEIGLSVIISMAGGNTGSETMKEALKLLSSTAYDRNLEKEADLLAVEYLINSKVDPEPLAEFLYDISGDESSMEKRLSWISTHPASKERAEYIIDCCKGKPTEYVPILSKETWEGLRENLSTY